MTLAAEIARNIETALAEDIGAGDLTAGLITADAVARASVICREAAVLWRRCVEGFRRALHLPA